MDGCGVAVVQFTLRLTAAWLGAVWLASVMDQIWVYNTGSVLSYYLFLSCAEKG